MRIETKRLLLRPVEESDAEDIFAYSKEENVGIHAGWKPHESLEETKGIMREVFLGKEGVFAIVWKENGTVVGMAGIIEDPKRENPRARMLGYASSEKYWGKGMMTEAVTAILAFAFGELGLDLVSAYCYPYNTRSKRVLEKCGFVCEGRLQKCEVRFDGAVLDNDCYICFRPQSRQQGVNYDT